MSRAVEDHQCQHNALLMLKLLVRGEADVAAGRTTSQDRVFEDLRSRLTAGANGRRPGPVSP